MTDNLPPITYGIWLKGRGWLKAKNRKTGRDEPCAFLHVDVAARTAQRTGGHVEPIDDSLIDLEEKLLQTEKMSSISWRLNALFNKAKG